MALLEITAISTSSTGETVPVRIELTDARGDSIYGFTDSGVFVLPQIARTDETGYVAFDLVPNADIQASVSTFYTLTIGSRSYLILKSGATQTVFEALATTPEGPTMTFLTSENNLSDLADAAEARDNLGLGDSATRNIGTSPGSVAAGDDPRFISNTDHNLLDNRDGFPAHPAAALEFTPYLGIVGTDVQTAIEEVYNFAIVNNDEADEIAFAPTGSIVATDVQAAIAKVSLDADQGVAHIADAVDAHDASAISFVPTSPFTAGTVQGAFDELFAISAAQPVNRIAPGAGSDQVTIRVTGDPFPRFIVNGDGTLEWATGLAVPDTNLYRSAANVLKTDDSMAIAGNNLTPTASSGSVRLVNTASIQWRNAADTGNVIGVAVDANDDTFLNCNTGDNVHLAIQGVPKVTLSASGLNIKAGTTRTLNVSSDADNTTATAGIFFGSSGDTNLYRSAADTLKTDDAFTSATSVSAPFVALDGSPATSGSLRVNNDGKLTWRNAANAANIDAVWVNASNNTVLNAATGQSIIQAINGTATITHAAGTSTYAEAQNIAIGTTTGSKIGTATTQKIGFWNATPVTQFNTTGASGYTSVGAGSTVKTTDTFTGGIGATAYTVGDLFAALKRCGIIAS